MNKSSSSSNNARPFYYTLSSIRPFAPIKSFTPSRDGTKSVSLVRRSSRRCSYAPRYRNTQTDRHTRGRRGGSLRRRGRPLLAKVERLSSLGSSGSSSHQMSSLGAERRSVWRLRLTCSSSEIVSFSPTRPRLVAPRAADPLSRCAPFEKGLRDYARAI